MAVSYSHLRSLTARELLSALAREKKEYSAADERR
jgi:hypothetical protein